jgi:4-carboxymuconolactone decarboxylase
VSDASKQERWEHGLEIVEKVYGAGSSEMMKGQQDSLFVGEIVRNVFGEIWSKPGLSIRDKRLLIIGATTMLGRPDLIAVQVAGAIVNGELTDEQLEEIPLLMLVYSGAGNTTALVQGIQAAKAKAKDMKPA